MPPDFSFPETPGDVLQEKFLTPLKISPERLARDFDVQESTIRQILGGRRRISRAMAHKLHMRLKTSTQFWLNLQERYDRERLAYWERLAR